MTQEVFLIDGSAFIYRAFHAVAPLTNSQGFQTNAVFGFINILRRLLNERQAHYAAVCFDSRGPVFRHRLYAPYKANRPPMPETLVAQVPYIKKAVSALGLVSFQEEDVEADDIIGSAAARLADQGVRVVIVSGDKDLLQLVGERVTMWDPMSDKVMDQAAVEKKYAVPPELLLDCYALIGDSSDNVPGVPGIGPKSAATLISQYGSLEKLYEAIDTLKASKMKERLIAHREEAFLSRKLIRLKMDVEVPMELDGYQRGQAREEELRELYSELEFTSLLRELDSESVIPRDRFFTVRSASELEELRSDLEGVAALAIDTETTSLNSRSAALVGISLSVDGSRCWYLPVGHLEADGRPAAGQLEPEQVRSVLAPLLQSPAVVKIGHNLKYDYTVLKHTLELPLKGPLVDTMIAAYLAEPARRSFKLDDLCLDHGYKLTSYETVTAADRRPDAFAYVKVETAGAYSCEDVFGAVALWEHYRELLDETGQRELFQQVEMALMPLLAEMENAGIKVDSDKLELLAVEFNQRLQSLEQKIHELAGYPFNINSPQQLGTVLYEDLGLPHGRRTKTGYSTDIKVLEKLAATHELPGLVITYRNFAKLLTTYVEKLKHLVEPQTGRVHTTFNQAVTATGRLSSSNPNLQNIPIRGEEGGRIREAFVPEPGSVFLSADYSQIDLRVLAHYSQDPALVEAFRNGEDIHARTAAEIFGVSSLLITPEMRRVAKSINFGIVYGMSAFGLAAQLQIARKEAQKFIDCYFELYSGVKRFMHEVVESARERGYVTTLLKRRRYLPELESSNKMRREFAERAAINTPIQGTAADIIKLAMLKVDRLLRDREDDCRMLLQIHDELIFEVNRKSSERVREPIRHEMEQAMKLDVPLVVNLQLGTSLAK